MGSDVDGEVIGEEFKGYTLRITGGNDKQGFAMKQGILVNGRVRILMKKSKSSTLLMLNVFCVQKLLSTDQEELVRERESQSEDASVDQTLLSSSLKFSRRVLEKSQA